jgi:hypothetical protein
MTLTVTLFKGESNDLADPCIILLSTSSVLSHATEGWRLRAATLACGHCAWESCS